MPKYKITATLKYVIEEEFDTDDFAENMKEEDINPNDIEAVGEYFHRMLDDDPFDFEPSFEAVDSFNIEKAK